VTVIVLGHMKKLWDDGPRGMLLLANLAGTALRMSLLAVVYATVGLYKLTYSLKAPGFNR
jgi:hypothetical protein